MSAVKNYAVLVKLKIQIFGKSYLFLYNLFCRAHDLKQFIPYSEIFEHQYGKHSLCF